MQIVSNGDSLYKMSYPVFWEKYFNMLADNFNQGPVVQN